MRQSLYHRDVVATVEVLCEEKVERKSMPTSDSDIVQEKSYSNGHGKPELVCLLRERFFVDICIVWHSPGFTKGNFDI
jgi:hypothetical protein